MKNKNIAIVAALFMGMLIYMPDTLYANDKNKDKEEKSTESNQGTDDISLGFDHYAYLPEDFNPYSGMLFDVDDIQVISCEEEVLLGFDHYGFLPEGFNPYYGIALSVDDIVVKEEVEEVIFDYDHKVFLPEGFNPYSGMLFEIDDIEIIEAPFDEDEFHQNSSLPSVQPHSLGR